MSEIHITGSNRFTVRREHALRWTVQLPRISSNNSTTFLMEVHSWSIDNLFPTIIQDYNDKLYYTFNGVSSYIQIAEGNYSAFDLVDSVQTGLQVLDPGFSVVYDDVQSKAQLVIPANVSIRFNRPNDPFGTFGTNDFSYSRGDDRFLELLGWNFQAQTIELSGGLAGFTWVPNNVVRCSGPAYVDLCVTLPLDNVFSQTKGRQNVVSRMFFENSAYNSRVVKENQVPEQYSCNLNGLSEFDFFIVDDHGVAVQPPKTIENIVVSYRISFIPNKGD